MVYNFKNDFEASNQLFELKKLCDFAFENRFSNKLIKWKKTWNGSAFYYKDYSLNTEIIENELSRIKKSLKKMLW